MKLLGAIYLRLLGPTLITVGGVSNCPSRNKVEGGTRGCLGSA